MATLSAWSFTRLQGADEMLAKLEELSRDFVISPHDAAVESWEVGRKKPNNVVPSVWRFCEGACEHELRP